MYRQTAHTNTKTAEYWTLQISFLMFLSYTKRDKKKKRKEKKTAVNIHI